VRFSMDAYLENCAGYAVTMAEEYRLHADANSETAARALELAGMIGDGDDLDSRYNAYRALCKEIEVLYTDFHLSDIAEDQQAVFGNAYANFQGEVSKIKYDEYHSLASEFNNAREGFPAAAVGGLLGLDPLNTF